MQTAKSVLLEMSSPSPRMSSERTLNEADTNGNAAFNTMTARTAPATPKTSTLAYHNFSLDGDARWARASKWTKRAPVVVLGILVLSVVETVLGAIWIVQLSTAMTVPKILQTLILPGMSIFNAMPSLHLHVLSRNNPPTLALCFSSIFVALWAISTLLFLISCNLPAHLVPLGLRQVECSTAVAGVASGPTKALWWIVVLFGVLFVALYATHATMALFVKRHGKSHAELDIQHGSVMMLSEAEREEARRKWRQYECCNA